MFGFVPGLLYIGFVLAVLALVFGVLSLRRQESKGIAGTVLGGFGLVLSLFFGFTYAGLSTTPEVDAADSAVSNSSPLPSSTSDSAEVPDVVGSSMADAATKLRDAGFNVSAPGSENDDIVATQTPAADAEAGTGSTVTLTPVTELGTAVTNPAPAGTKFGMETWGRPDESSPDYRLWFDEYNDNYVPGDSWDAPDADKKYVTIKAHVEAIEAGVSAGLATYDVALTDADGNLYDATYVTGVEDVPSVTLGKGQSTEGTLVFEVPNTVSGGVLSFADGARFVKTS
ncbi:PASTA domain-containing protein [Curtobacterium sp. MCLR17_007]|uniref:PASTA domain-containing protein n=1 Tax=Curtobacterium sp. MCLR17_007 TaxID=2175648 RepID=UPI0015E8D0F8|nr:PASTA domain-containing protein [Curtobacterium sp. MCLR17_007]WIB61445.1 PASTA domain-containing protein [Curtobacterium sp. MCLR17_007]